MSESFSLKFACLLGSLRKGSLNAVVAQELASLSPPGVEVVQLGPVSDFPHLLLF